MKSLREFFWVILTLFCARSCGRVAAFNPLPIHQQSKNGSNKHCLGGCFVYASAWHITNRQHVWPDDRYKLQRQAKSEPHRVYVHHGVGASLRQVSAHLYQLQGGWAGVLFVLREEKHGHLGRRCAMRCGVAEASGDGVPRATTGKNRAERRRRRRDITSVSHKSTHDRASLLLQGAADREETKYAQTSSSRQGKTRGTPPPLH